MVRKLGISAIETTVTPDNRASDRLFTAFAARHGAALEREVLFDGGLFPDGDGEGAHQPEVLYRIGPLSPLSPLPGPARPGHARASRPTGHSRPTP